MFSLQLEWFPATGWGGFDGDQFFASDMVLPSLTLGFFYAAYISRLTRGGMLDNSPRRVAGGARARAGARGGVGGAAAGGAGGSEGTANVARPKASEAPGGSWTVSIRSPLT